MADIRRMTSVGARGTNPVLPAGVYGWERDTGVVKLGDGVTQWNNLGLAGIAPGAIPASVVLKIEAVTASEYATLPWVDPEIMYVIDDGRVLLGSKSLASSGLDQPADSDLTAIAALVTTSYGRSLLTTADVDALATALAPRAAYTSRYAPRVARFAPATIDMTKTLKVMSSPPTVGSLATSSAIVGGVLVAPGAVLGANNAVQNAGRFRWLGGKIEQHGTANPDYNYYRSKQNTDPYSSTNTPAAVEFWFDGTDIELLFKGITSSVWVAVDDEYVASSATSVPNTGSTYYLPLTFASRRVRRIRFESSIGLFGGVMIGANDTVNACVPGVNEPTVAIVGDSFSEFAGGSGSTRPWWRTMGDLLGWRDIRGLGQGGTGYTQTGSGGRPVFLDRIATDVTPYSHDIVFLCGGVNDTGASDNAIAAQVSACVAAILAVNANCIVFVVAPFMSDGVDGQPTGFWTRKAAMKAAALAAGARWLDLTELPLGDTPASGTTSASYTSGTSLSVSVPFPRNCTIEVGGVRRQITTCTGSGPYTLTLVSALGTTVASGSAVTEVGPALWTGTGQVGTTTGSGNCDLYVYSDGTHPTRAGLDAMGATMAQLVAYSLRS